MATHEGHEMRGFSELDLGPVESLGVSVVSQPGATLLSLTADALGGRPQGIPADWRAHIRSHAPADSVAVLRPLFAPDHSGVPYCLTPDTTARSVPDIATYLEQVADLSPEVLLDDLTSDFGGAVPPQWRPVVDHPRRWIASYVRVLEAVWTAFSPIWQRADPLLKRETERVGTAVVGGTLDVLLAGINSRYRFEGTSLYVPDVDPEKFSLDGRRLLLIPVISGSTASIFSFEQPDVAWIGYPMPGMGLLWESRKPPATGDPLTLIVGEMRALILRRVGRPATMGELAGVLDCSASTATYHCGQLEMAGLIVRERHGRHVRLRRTDRGDALIDLLA
ncbi:ArsR/SmtB family transcription factor [Amycolatopsis sp. cg5]|uniref:ArsR/SmtB family transcription factor n=1 Tax=Amycolatopsis sp. cg5 TaxID=3238802 RepID=UPI003524D4E8